MLRSPAQFGTMGYEYITVEIKCTVSVMLFAVNKGEILLARHPKIMQWHVSMLISKMKFQFFNNETSCSLIGFEYSASDTDAIGLFELNDYK